jgi:hypothetical protein
MSNSTLSESSWADESLSIPALVAALALHTAAVYVSTPEVSLWMVGHWIGWIAQPFRRSIDIPVAGWYLQHLVVFTVLPAAILGYVRVARFLPSTLRERIGPSRADGAALWSSAIPTLVLAYRMLVYHAQPPSVLYGSSISAMKYFFDIQQIVPTWMHPLGSDPV